MHLSLHVGFGAKFMSISLKKVRESSNNIWGEKKTASMKTVIWLNVTTRRR